MVSTRGTFLGFKGAIHILAHLQKEDIPPSTIAT